MFQPAINRFDSMLDAQHAWEIFYQDVKDGDRVGLTKDPYIRLNPELKKKIKMDDVKAVNELRNDVRTTLRLEKWAFKCSVVAKRLISSSFYFERDENRFNQEKIIGINFFLF